MKLTLPQQDIYFEQLLFPNDPIYNIGAKIAVNGNLDYVVLRHSFKALINQHDAYRSVLRCQDEEVQIELLDTSDAELEFRDFSRETDPHERANEYMERVFLNAFDITAGKPLYRFVLVKVGSMSHYIFSMYHHLITDGWGTSLMFQRWVKNYNEMMEQGCIASQYPFTYTDFVQNDLEYQHSDDFVADGNYWKEKFTHLPEQLLEK
jgi:surfactin family lipopeptide synthetase A